MKRWYQSRESTHPRTVTKNTSDKDDLDYLSSWLAENEMHIEFEKYEGKPKSELLVCVRGYRESCRENMELMEALRSIIKEEDWAML